MHIFAKVLGPIDFLFRASVKWLSGNELMNAYRMPNITKN